MQNKDSISFYKMEGLGNDFILIDAGQFFKKDNYQNYNNIISYVNDNFYYLDKEFIKKISDRNLGIGCDQIGIFNYNNANNSLYLAIYNQDGSDVSMCVNITRCIASLIFLLYGDKKLNIYINNKVVKAIINEKQIAEIDIGQASEKISEVDLVRVEKLIQESGLRIDYFKCINVGNNHLVLVLDTNSKNKFNFDIEKFGEHFSNNKVFAKVNNINVGFANIIDRSNISLSVYEVGAGLTLSCGSGAAAAFAAIYSLCLVDNLVSVHFKHGDLLVKQDEAGNIIISGNCNLIFSGKYFI